MLTDVLQSGLEKQPEESQKIPPSKYDRILLV
jgi:hypothetical protein